MIDLSQPKVMGILNITPDSFYDGNSYTNETDVLKRVEDMLEEGADIIDIGAFSSRPGADFVDDQSERQRLMPFLKSIVKHFPEAYISIDTYRHQIAKEAVANGAKMINDISGGNLDAQMFETIAGLQVPYVMMHMQGTPKTMQNNPVYNDVVTDIKNFFKTKITILEQMGFDKIILDPGFGFGKTLTQNYNLLRRLPEFADLNYPILVGISRKSMLYKALGTSPDKALNATTVAHSIALMKGAKILRVHDVKEAVEAVKLVQLLQTS
jgi:dihydropteroate synthase